MILIMRQDKGCSSSYLYHLSRPLGWNGDLNPRFLPWWVSQDPFDSHILCYLGLSIFFHLANFKRMFASFLFIPPIQMKIKKFSLKTNPFKWLYFKCHVTISKQMNQTDSQSLCESFKERVPNTLTTLRGYII